MTNKEAIEQLLIIKDSLMNCGGCDGARQSLTCIYLAIKGHRETIRVDNVPKRCYLCEQEDEDL